MEHKETDIKYERLRRKKGQVPTNFQQKLHKEKPRDHAGRQYLKGYWLKTSQQRCERLNYFLMKNYRLRN